MARPPIDRLVEALKRIETLEDAREAIERLQIAVGTLVKEDDDRYLDARETMRRIKALEEAMQELKARLPDRRTGDRRSDHRRGDV